ncbi:hypothetical protein I6A84_02275 [Frankia sp. CNm7]|uniref:hypothetical protein n=1 Tax=Frankia nepalensis TaxID=1836974 RepID=UPI0019345495|nr:hypothetical protein [Frankia nepalensis]MBL7516984.1 hypothetical protein [Frankia nepalensis]
MILAEAGASALHRLLTPVGDHAAVVTLVKAGASTLRLDQMPLPADRVVVILVEAGASALPGGATIPGASQTVL